MREDIGQQLPRAIEPALLGEDDGERVHRVEPAGNVRAGDGSERRGRAIEVADGQVRGAEARLQLRARDAVLRGVLDRRDRAARVAAGDVDGRQVEIRDGEVRTVGDDRLQERRRVRVSVVAGQRQRAFVAAIQIEQALRIVGGRTRLFAPTAVPGSRCSRASATVPPRRRRAGRSARARRRLRKRRPLRQPLAEGDCAVAFVAGTIPQLPWILREVVELRVGQIDVSSSRSRRRR